MHYVYLSLYYLSLVMTLTAVLLAGLQLSILAWYLASQAFATDANMDRERVETAGLSAIIALCAGVIWFLVNRLVAMLGDINAL